MKTFVGLIPISMKFSDETQMLKAAKTRSEVYGSLHSLHNFLKFLFPSLKLANQSFKLREDNNHPSINIEQFYLEAIFSSKQQPSWLIPHRKWERVAQCYCTCNHNLHLRHELVFFIFFSCFASCMFLFVCVCSDWPTELFAQLQNNHKKFLPHLSFLPLRNRASCWTCQKVLSTFVRD